MGKKESLQALILADCKKYRRNLITLEQLQETIEYVNKATKEAKP